MDLTQAHLGCLPAIYELGHITPDVGAVEIAKALKVSRPSVTG